MRWGFSVADRQAASLPRPRRPNQSSFVVTATTQTRQLAGRRTAPRGETQACCCRLEVGQLSSQDNGGLTPKGFALSKS